MMEKSFIDQQDVCENLHQIEHQMAEACMRSGRRPEDVILLGVTKTVAPERINAAISAGLRHIGENRVQEFLGKRNELHLDGVDVHLIGHLQTNKVPRIVPAVNMIESVDSLKLAQAIHAASIREQRVMDVLVEVNIGRETAKSGVFIEQLEELLYSISQLSGIKVRGLMTVPPILDSECEKREVFSQMYKVFVDIKGKNIDNVSMDVLSMGMSADYKEAIWEGSTLVRVGSALFGQRQYPI